MSVISSMFGNVPGMGTVVETFEQAITWGPAYALKWWSAYINANAIDVGNTGTTWRLRPGLVLGQSTATGQWTNYNNAATDGSQIASGVLAYGLRMQDVLTGLNTTKFYAIVVGGNVKGANLLGLDAMARSQLSGRFTFDDNLVGNAYFDFVTFQSKTSNYSILPTDNFTQFDNFGAAGTVTFTLPPIANLTPTGNGYKLGFRCVANQTLAVTSFEGANIVGFNNAAANTLQFSTGSQKIGGGLVFYTNALGTLWYVTNTSAGTNTISVS
jgi:hypothetical protein